MKSVKQLNDLQCELLLMRSCSGVSKLYFNLRTTNPVAVQQVTHYCDQPLIQFLRNIVTGDGAGFSPLQKRIATLPTKDGVLGVLTMADSCTFCFLASCFQSKDLQVTILKISPGADPRRAYSHAMSQYTLACGLPSFDINSISTRPMKSLAVM